MKLGGKSRDVDSFVDQLKEEGEIVTAGAYNASTTVPLPTEMANTDLYVMLRI